MMLHKCAREEKYVQWMWFDNFDEKYVKWTWFNNFEDKSGLVDRSTCARAKKTIWFHNANIKFLRNFNGLPLFELVFQIVQSWRSIDFERTFLCPQIYQKTHEMFGFMQGRNPLKNSLLFGRFEDTLGHSVQCSVCTDIFQSKWNGKFFMTIQF